MLDEVSSGEFQTGRDFSSRVVNAKVQAFFGCVVGRAGVLPAREPNQKSNGLNSRMDLLHFRSDPGHGIEQHPNASNFIYFGGLTFVLRARNGSDQRK